MSEPAPVRARVRSAAVGARDRAIAPVLARLDDLTRGVEALDSRLRRVESLIESLDGRAASAAESVVAAEESQERLSRRLDAIEELLSASSPAGEGGDPEAP